MIPQRPEVAFSYLQFVLASNRVNALEPAALKAAGFRPPGTLDESGHVSNWTTLLGATGDRLISLNRFEAALGVSNRMHESGWVQMPPPSASAPLTNASFRFPISGHGFDWTPTRPRASRPIRCRNRKNSGLLSLELSLNNAGFSSRLSFCSRASTIASHGKPSRPTFKARSALRGSCPLLRRLPVLSFPIRWSARIFFRLAAAIPGASLFRPALKRFCLH